MANQTDAEDVDPYAPYAPLGTRHTIDADVQRACLTYRNDMGLRTTTPLQLLLDLVRRAPGARTGEGATLAEFDMYDVLSWTWTEPATEDRGPLPRAARLIIQEIPLTIPVRRQLPDGSWGTVDVSPEEWAHTEGRRTRGVSVDGDQEHGQEVKDA